MGVTINGNNITITNATIELVNGFNAESGVSYIIITPDGGVGEIPFMAQGLPGQPTLFTSITYTQLPAGTPLPVPNPAVTILDQGGSGIPARYALNFFGNAGDAGPPGSPSIAGASDLAATPALDANAEKFILVYRNSDQMWVPTAQKVGDAYTAAAIPATAFDTTNPRTLSSIAVPPQPFAWRPRPFAQVPVTGSVDTRVDVFARLNDPTSSGAQVGYSKGRVGATPPVNIVIPAPIPGESVPGAYGVVAAGVGASIFLRAEQLAASSNAWGTAEDPESTFMVEVQPIP